MDFISCKIEMNLRMAGAARWGSVERGEGRVFFREVYAGKLFGLNNKLLCCFKLAADMVNL